MQIVIQKWLSEGVMRPELIEQGLQMFQNELREIKGITEKSPWLAYTRLMSSISFLNAAAQQRIGIIDRLLNWISDIKDALDGIVKKIGASGYSIGVSAPFGLSISVSFSVKE